MRKELQNLSVNNLSTVREKINDYSIKILTIASDDPKIEYYNELIKRLDNILDNLHMDINELKNKYITHIEEDINTNEQDLYENAQNTGAMNIEWIQPNNDEQDNGIYTESTENIFNEQSNNKKP